MRLTIKGGLQSRAANNRVNTVTGNVDAKVAQSTITNDVAWLHRQQN